MEEAPRREDGQADETVVALGLRDHQRGERHFGHVEIAEAQLPPEQFGWTDDAGHQLDAVGFRATVENRTGARIFRESDAESDLHGRFSPSFSESLFALTGI